MVVNRTALWIVVAICCAPSVVIATRLKLRHRSFRAWRREPLHALGACVDGVMTGVGAGLAAALVVVVASGLWVRLTR